LRAKLHGSDSAEVLKRRNRFEKTSFRRRSGTKLILEVERAKEKGDAAGEGGEGHGTALDLHQPQKRKRKEDKKGVVFIAVVFRGEKG